MGLRYRVEQFWRIVTAVPLPAVAQADIAAVLSKTELELFGQFTFSDQWHSYRVLQTLRQAGHKDKNLLVAALLHDVGKTRVPLSVWDRTWIVLAQALVPQRMAAWGTGVPRGWKRPFVVKAQHPAWGAELAQAAGSKGEVVALIRRHQDSVPMPPAAADDRMLQLLQWADDQN